MRKIGNAALVTVESGSWGWTPLVVWEWYGQRVRVGEHHYLKNIGNGLSIRINSGEVFLEEEEPMEHLFRTS